MLTARHLGEQREHDPGGRVPLAARQERFDPLGVPIEGDAVLFKCFDKSVRDAVPSSDSRYFVHKDLADLAGRGEILNSPQAVSFIIARLAGDCLLAHFDDRIAFGLGVLLQLGYLAIGLLFRS